MIVQLQRDLFLSKSGNRYVDNLFDHPPTKWDASLPPHLAPTIIANKVSESKYWWTPISPNAMSTTNGAIGPSSPVRTFCYQVTSKRHIANVVAQLPRICWLIAVPLFQGRRSTSRFDAFAPKQLLFGSWLLCLSPTSVFLTHQLPIPTIMLSPPFKTT